jgi:hypothetical protein
MQWHLQVGVAARFRQPLGNVRLLPQTMNTLDIDPSASIRSSR